MKWERLSVSSFSSRWTFDTILEYMCKFSSTVYATLGSFLKTFHVKRNLKIASRPQKVTWCIYVTIECSKFRRKISFSSSSSTSTWMSGNCLCVHVYLVHLEMCYRSLTIKDTKEKMFIRNIKHVGIINLDRDKWAREWRLMLVDLFITRMKTIL